MLKDLDMLSKSLHKAKINFNMHILHLLNEAQRLYKKTHFQKAENQVIFWLKQIS